MDVTAALGALAAAGSEQTRKTYLRHGAPEPLFGVLFSRLRDLARQIGTDHDLALALFANGNTDARTLATLVADPARLDPATADAWAATPYHVLSDLVAQVVARSPIALDRMAAWVASPDEYTARCGWSVMAQLATHDRDVPDAAFTPYLSIIERRIHAAPNRTREGMNGALIAIGGRSDTLSTPAIAAARRIGPVTIDHGDTACQTPFAPDYISKMRSRAASRSPAAKKAAPKKVAPKKAAAKAKPAAPKKAAPTKAVAKKKPAAKKR